MSLQKNSQLNISCVQSKYTKLHLPKITEKVIEFFLIKKHKYLGALREP